MIVIMSICHAFRTNEDFSPELFYAAAFVIDYFVVIALH